VTWLIKQLLNIIKNRNGFARVEFKQAVAGCRRSRIDCILDVVACICVLAAWQGFLQGLFTEMCP